MRKYTERKWNGLFWGCKRNSFIVNENDVKRVQAFVINGQGWHNKGWRNRGRTSEQNRKLQLFVLRKALCKIVVVFTGTNNPFASKYRTTTARMSAKESCFLDKRFIEEQIWKGFWKLQCNFSVHEVWISKSSVFEELILKNDEHNAGVKLADVSMEKAPENISP